jgi:hypothetical protein
MAITFYLPTKLIFWLWECGSAGGRGKKIRQPGYASNWAPECPQNRPAG